MSENILKIRGKFINKFVAKIESINNDFELLSKVDKKIFSKVDKKIFSKVDKKLNKNNNQIGGDTINLNELQMETLQRKLILQKQQKILDSLKLQLDSINNKIPYINEVLKTTTSDIRKININIPDFKDMSVPLVSTISPSDLLQLEDAFNNVTPWSSFYFLNKNNNIIKNNQITKEQYEKFIYQIN